MTAVAIAAPDYSTWRAGRAECWRQLRALGIRIPASVQHISDVLGDFGYEVNGHRRGRGSFAVWYSDIEKRTGLCRRTVAAAMRFLRKHGLIDGRPNPADPANHFYRERATYTLTIPAVCRQTLNRLAYRARQVAAGLFGSAVAAIHPGRTRGKELRDREIRSHFSLEIDGDTTPEAPRVGGAMKKQRGHAEC
jgi:hypothetical protein